MTNPFISELSMSNLKGRIGEGIASSVLTMALVVRNSLLERKCFIIDDDHETKDLKVIKDTVISEKQLE